MRWLAATILIGTLAAFAPAAPLGGGSVHCEARRVKISLWFAGAELFFFGTVPAGTESVVVVTQAPGRSGVRLMQKGRIGPFWLGVRQYRLDDGPGLYQVLLHCPGANVLGPCIEPVPLARINRMLAARGVLVGPEAIVAQARVAVLSGPQSGEVLERVLEGFWHLQERAGLYRVLVNAVRINGNGQFYGRVPLPAKAPEGKYRVTAYFLGENAALGSASTELFVRRTGVVAWLARLAERKGALYGVLTVCVALAAGWLAGAAFRGRTSH